MTSRQQSRSNDTWSHDSSKTISLANLESVGKEDRKEPPFPSLKDCQGQCSCYKMRYDCWQMDRQQIKTDKNSLFFHQILTTLISSYLKPTAHVSSGNVLFGLRFHHLVPVHTHVLSSYFLSLCHLSSCVVVDTNSKNTSDN